MRIKFWNKCNRLPTPVQSLNDYTDPEMNFMVLVPMIEDRICIRGYTNNGYTDFIICCSKNEIKKLFKEVKTVFPDILND